MEVPDGLGPERIAKSTQAYASVLGAALRPTAAALFPHASQLAEPGERIVTFFQALSSTPKGKVVIVLTTAAFYVVSETNGLLQERHELRGTVTREWRTDFMWGFRMTLSTPSGLRTYKQPLPVDEGFRLAVACGHEDPWIRDLMAPTHSEPDGPPIAYCGPLTLFPDRLVDAELRHLPLGGDVRTTVDTAGNIAVTRGRDLGEKAVGTLLLGPIGLFMMGNARERQTDTRELFLLVEGPGWVLTQQFTPDSGHAVREFAGVIGIQTRAFPSSAEAPRPEESGTDPSLGLSRLVELREAGHIDDTEFRAAKAKLLGLD